MTDAVATVPGVHPQGGKNQKIPAQIHTGSHQVGPVMGEHLGDVQHLRINSFHRARQIDGAGIGHDPEKRAPTCTAWPALSSSLQPSAETDTVQSIGNSHGSCSRPGMALYSQLYRKIRVSESSAGMGGPSQIRLEDSPRRLKLEDFSLNFKPVRSSAPVGPVVAAACSVKGRRQQAS